MSAMAQRLKRAGRRSRYRLRKQVVEPVFGQIKQARGFRQFLLRGLDQVRAEWAMICTVHNLLKLATGNRTVKPGHPVSSSHTCIMPVPHPPLYIRQHPSASRRRDIHHTVAKEVTILTMNVRATLSPMRKSIRWLSAKPGICLVQRLLDRDGTGYRVSDTSDFARTLSPAVPQMRPLPRAISSSAIARCEVRRRQGRLLVRVHEAAVALDVSDQDGSELALKRGGLRTRPFSVQGGEC
jgi:hypothetical protein